MSDGVNPIAPYTPPIRGGWQFLANSKNISRENLGSVRTTELVETLSFNIFSCLKSSSSKKSEDTHPGSVAPISNHSGENENSQKNDQSQEMENEVKEEQETGLITQEILFQRLKSHGYTNLIEALQNKTRYPWNEFLKIESPKHIEQVVEICDLLKIKQKLEGSLNDQKVVELACNIAGSSAPNTSTILGQLIFLLTKSSSDVFKNIETKDTKSIINWVEIESTKVIRKSTSHLATRSFLHLQSKVQNGKVTLRNDLALQIANLLISDTGRVNFGIIDNVLENFLQKGIPSFSSESNLLNVLKQLQIKPHLRELLVGIKKPNSQNSPSSEVIRSTVGIGPGETIKDSDAIITALTALLSHHRQGKDGSCFATPLAIALLRTNLEQCVCDFKSLLQFGKMSRKTNQISQDFPFLIPLGASNLTQHFDLTKDGKVVEDNIEGAQLADLPAIINTCRILGITDPKSCIALIISKLRVNEHSHVPITIKILLQHFAEQAKQLKCNEEVGAGTLYLRACCTFEATQTNPLLQAWENSIAGMAEADETGMVRSAVLNSVIDTFKIQMEAACKSTSEIQNIILEKFRVNLVNQIHLQYDPSIKNRGLSSDKNSTEGAFVLYDKNNQLSSQSWIRIDNPEAFQGFILKLLDITLVSIESKFVNVGSKGHKAIKRQFEILCRYAKTSSFILANLHQYFHRNLELIDPIKNYESIKYAPWVTKSGNNFSKVIQVYFEEFKTSNSEHFTPTSPKDLLSKILRIREKVSRDCLITDTLYPEFIPARIPGVHACNLMINHPTLQKITSPSTDFNGWFNSRMLVPGKEVSESLIEMDTRSTFINEVIEELIPESLASGFRKKLAEYPKDISISDFRGSILIEIDKFKERLETSADEIPLIVDTALFCSLPKKLENKMTESAIHFIDTNWAEGVHDVHFVFVVNPGTGKLEVWASYEDNSKMFPVKQDLWLKNREWELFTNIQTTGPGFQFGED